MATVSLLKQCILGDNLPPLTEARKNNLQAVPPPDAKQLQDWERENQRIVRRLLRNPGTLIYSVSLILANYTFVGQ